MSIDHRLREPLAFDEANCIWPHPPGAFESVEDCWAESAPLRGEAQIPDIDAFRGDLDIEDTLFEMDTTFESYGVGVNSI